MTGRRSGRLFARHGGDGDHVVILLHGLVASGDVFGAAFDSLTSQSELLVPDLLGFGRSIDEKKSTFELEEHLDALDELVSRAAAFDRPFVLGTHSMGASVALHWSARHPGHVPHISCWGAPVYPDPAAVNAALGAAGTMARLFVADTRWASWACRMSCRNRLAAGWIAAALSPSLPVPIARGASAHTWPAYRDAITHFVLEPDWRSLVEVASRAGADVSFTWGEEDPIGDKELACSFADALVDSVAGADHRLPMSHGAMCATRLRATMADRETRG
ncbi:MAG: alpha/beta fold hydrolase [Acidimicrobiales bacterium]